MVRIPAAASRSSIMNMMKLAHGSGCPCHGCAAVRGNTFGAVKAGLNLIQGHNQQYGNNRRGYATPVDAALQKEYGFEMASSSIRFGEGVTMELGMDFANMKAQKVGVFTDPTVRKLTAMKQAVQSLEASGIKYEIYDRVRVEPNDESWADAIKFARANDFTHFLAVGGGSVMDTAKVANLFTCYPEAEILDFVNAPIGKGIPVDKVLRPLLAVPTTAGTGSETTGTAIFDYAKGNAKTGIASRAMRPLLGIVDPLNTETCPTEVHISSGLDVLFHAMESYTAIPYTERVPRPQNPINRPAYQGSNPISDVFSLYGIKAAVKYLPRIARDRTDKEARGQMLIAATMAGIGFGNAGVHLPHGCSYAVSGLNKTKAKWNQPGYEVDHYLIPHGASVAVTGPAVFAYTAPSDPARHRELAEIFGAENIDRVPDHEIGEVLYDKVAEFLTKTLGIPRGLSAYGFSKDAIPALVEGTLPQRRVLDLAPGFSGGANDAYAEQLTAIFERSMSY